MQHQIQTQESYSKIKKNQPHVRQSYQFITTEYAIATNTRIKDSKKSDIKSLIFVKHREWKNSTRGGKKRGIENREKYSFDLRRPTTERNVWHRKYDEIMQTDADKHYAR